MFVPADDDETNNSKSLPFSNPKPQDTDEELRKTGLLPQHLRRRMNASQDDNQPITTSSLGDSREVILLIRGMVERLMLDEKIVYTLGRYEAGARSLGEIDLTPYGALDRGVSRAHLKLHFEDGRLYVTDLGSTNGTYLAGKRLEPDKVIMLRKGDELVLGRLPIQILFR